MRLRLTVVPLPSMTIMPLLPRMHLTTPIARLPTPTRPIRAPAISPTALQLRQLDPLARPYRRQRQQRRAREEPRQRVVVLVCVVPSSIAAPETPKPRRRKQPISLASLRDTVRAVPVRAVLVRVRDVLRAAVLRAPRAHTVDAAGAAGAGKRGEGGEVREVEGGGQVERVEVRGVQEEGWERGPWAEAEIGGWGGRIGRSRGLRGGRGTAGASGGDLRTFVLRAGRARGRVFRWEVGGILRRDRGGMLRMGRRVS